MIPIPWHNITKVLAMLNAKLLFTRSHTARTRECSSKLAGNQVKNVKENNSLHSRQMNFWDLLPWETVAVDSIHRLLTLNKLTNNPKMNYGRTGQSCIWIILMNVIVDAGEVVWTSTSSRACVISLNITSTDGHRLTDQWHWMFWVFLLFLVLIPDTKIPEDKGQM